MEDSAPVFDDRVSEGDLEAPRRKPRAAAASILYRFTSAAAPVLGRRRLLSWYLDLSRWFHRLSFEIAGELYGESFHLKRLAVTGSLIRRLLPENGSVLDVGCGTGRWSHVASEQAGTVVAIDLSATNIETARRLHPGPNIEFVVGDVAQMLPESAGPAFDLALLIHVLEHIDDAVDLLSRLRRLARTVLVEVPDFEADMLNHVRRSLGRAFYSDSDHVREYTESVLREQLGRAGLRVLLLENRRGSILAVATGDTNAVL